MKAASLIIAAVLAASLVACERHDAPAKAPTQAAQGSGVALPAALFATTEPANAQAPVDAKKSAKAGEQITLRGRIGGNGSPFVDGRAVFTIVGAGLKSCSDNPGDACKTPWDYCCESKSDIAAHSATVQVVDAAGLPLKADAKGQGGLKELSEVVVVGKVAQADANVLVVNAGSVFVAKP